MDWLKLISEVKERPYLWKTPSNKRILTETDILWKQVSKRVGFSESRCRIRWNYLRLRYVRLKKRTDKIANYKSSWEYWEHLKFLDDRVISKGLVNIHQLIAEVKKRPYMWKVPEFQRNTKIIAELWREVAEKVGSPVSKCRIKWCHLRMQHKKHKKREDKLLKESSSTKYNCSFQFYEELKFLNVLYDCSSSSEDKTVEIFQEVDKFELIAKVKEKPYLWRVQPYKRNFKTSISLWKEIAEHFVGVDATTCKTMWNTLRGHYGTFKKKEDKALQSSKKYVCKWKYYNSMKFLSGDYKNEHVPKVKIDAMGLIPLVKRQPELWEMERDVEKANSLWIEIAQILHVDVHKCKKKWSQLRSLHKQHKEKEDKLLKESSTKYDCTWKYYEEMKFLNVLYESNSPPKKNIDKPGKIDNFDLIAKVKEKPYLWQLPACQRNLNIYTSLWKQIANNMGVDETLCKSTWRFLRKKYVFLKKQEDNDLQSFNKVGRYWTYYNSLKFLSGVCNDDDNVCEVKFDKLYLIALVKRQPELWKIEKNAESIKKAATLWKEIGQTLGVDVNVCKKQWGVLRAKYVQNRKQEPTKTVACTWDYQEHLKFLDDLIDSGAFDTDKIDRYAFIAKVKERPELWRVNANEWKKYQIECLWKEISLLLDINYERCKKMWLNMRSLYRKHKEMEEKLLESSTKYYSTWEYYEHLKFLDIEDGEVPVDVHRHALIAKVKENPNLWKADQNQADENITTNKWKEIAEHLGVPEQTCRNVWMDLRSLFFKHKEKRERLLKEKPYAIHERKWEFTDALTFLDEEAKTSDDTPERLQKDMLNLINNVKERPYLWKTGAKDRNKRLEKYYWSQVKEFLGLTEEQCETEWNELRSMYYNEKERIEFLKQNGIDDEAENSESEWVYFKYLKFLDSDISDDQGSENAIDVQQMTKTEVSVRLITEVKKWPYLWKYYYNGGREIEVLNDMWTEVAAICGLEVRNCKTRWNNMKFRYKSKYIAFKENKIDIETFRKFSNYERLKFLNEELDEELKMNNSQNQNANADASSQNFDNNCFDDNVSSQHSNSTDIDEGLSCENSIVHLKSVCVKEEPQVQCSSFKSIPLKSIESTSIKEEIDISIKKEDSSESHSIEAEADEYFLDLRGNIKKEPNTDDIFIKEEFENDFPEQQANQFVNIDNECIREEQDRAINSVPIKNECLKVESYITNWVKTTDDSDIEFLKDIANDEIDDTCAIKKFYIPRGDEFVKEKTNSCYNVTNKDFDVKPYIPNWVKSRETSNIEFITDLAEANEVETLSVMQKLNRPSGSKPINKNTPARASLSKESFGVKPYISHWVKNREVSNIEFIPDNEERTSNVIQKLNLPIGSELVNKNSKITRLDNSAMDFNEDKAELNKYRKRSHKNTNGSKVLKKQRKKNN